MAVDDNVLLVCDMAAGSASAFDVGEDPSAPRDMLQPLATVQLVPEQVRPSLRKPPGLTLSHICKVYECVRLLGVCLLKPSVWAAARRAPQ